MPALLIFAYSRYAQTAKIIARISSPYVRKCTRHRGLRSAPSAGFGDPAEGIAGAANKGFAASAALALAGLKRRSGRSSETPGPQPPGAARLAGDIGAIPCETQGGSSRVFLPGQSRASFRNPGFGLEGMLCAAPNGVQDWQFVRVRQGWQVCGCSAVCVVLQDWQDRRDVAQAGDIPETGDPRCQNHMPAPHAPSVPDTCR